MNDKTLIANRHFSVQRRITTNHIPMHSHADYVVSYMVDGTSRCQIGQDRQYRFRTGDLGLLNPGEAHEDLESATERAYVVVNLKTEMFLELLSDVGYDAGAPPHFLSHREHTDSTMRRIFECLDTELKTNEWGRRLLIDSLLMEAVIHLARRYTDAPYHSRKIYSDPHSVCPRRVRRAIEYLHNNYVESISLDQLCAVAGLSRFHLCRTFKKATGLSPHSYAMTLRLEKTKQLLISSSKPIAEIALEMGFFDQSHFSNFFKKYTGMTAQVFRNGSQ